MTSVGENEEKANTIQPPLLVFFSPSYPISSNDGRIGDWRLRFHVRFL